MPNSADVAVVGHFWCHSTPVTILGSCATASALRRCRVFVHSGWRRLHPRAEESKIRVSNCTSMRLRKRHDEIALAPTACDTNVDLRLADRCWLRRERFEILESKFQDRKKIGHQLFGRRHA